MVLTAAPASFPLMLHGALLAMFLQVWLLISVAETIGTYIRLHTCTDLPPSCVLLLGARD